MTWDEMEGLERAMSFKKLQKLFQEAMEREYERIVSEAKEAQTSPFLDLMDESKFQFGYGRPMQIIPDGEWKLIKSLKAGEKRER